MRLRKYRRDLVVWSQSASSVGRYGTPPFTHTRRIRRWIRTGALLTVVGLMPLARALGAKTSHGAALARTLRSSRWPRFALAGAVLAVVGVTLLSGAAQAGVALLGMTAFLVALLQGLGLHQCDPVDVQLGRDQMTLARSSWIGSRREQPVPPGAGPG